MMRPQASCQGPANRCVRVCVVAHAVCRHPKLITVPITQVGGGHAHSHTLMQLWKAPSPHSESKILNAGAVPEGSEQARMFLNC